MVLGRPLKGATKIVRDIKFKIRISKFEIFTLLNKLKITLDGLVNSSTYIEGDCFASLAMTPMSTFYETVTLKAEKSIWDYQTTKNEFDIHLTRRAIPNDQNSNDQNTYFHIAYV